MKFEVKAGRFLYDKETKKVAVSKEKGIIKVQQVSLIILRMKNNKPISHGSTLTHLLNN